MAVMLVEVKLMLLTPTPKYVAAQDSLEVATLPVGHVQYQTKVSTKKIHNNLLEFHLLVNFCLQVKAFGSVQYSLLIREIESMK